MKQDAPEKFTKPYQPQEVEPAIYKKWAESGFFNPDQLPPKADGTARSEPYTIIMPPPNANGSLHAGHAVFVTLEDLLIRYNRMRGKKTLWLPGADHAGFETQVVYEKKAREGGPYTLWYAACCASQRDIAVYDGQQKFYGGPNAPAWRLV